MATKLKVIAVATPEFAIPTLDVLAAAEDVELAAVITNPDRQKGRGMEYAPTPVKVWALARRVPLFTTEALTGEKAAAKINLAPFMPFSALAVVASSLFIPRWLREPSPTHASYGAVNLHPSLLPKLRGPAPIQRAIIRGYEYTGVTTLALVKEMDAGDILMQSERVPITPRETAGTLSAKLAQRGALLILDTLRGLAAGTVSSTPQDKSQATAAAKITPETQKVDWKRPAKELDRLIRGLYPEPLARTTFGGEPLLLLDAEPVAGGGEPGTITAIEGDALIIACGEDSLRVSRVKPAGKDEMSAAAWGRGRHLGVGAAIV